MATNGRQCDSPDQEREGFVVGAFEDLLFLPALDSLNPFLARTAPIFRDERHRVLSRSRRQLQSGFAEYAAVASFSVKRRLRPLLVQARLLSLTVRCAHGSFQSRELAIQRAWLCFSDVSATSAGTTTRFPLKCLSLFFLTTFIDCICLLLLFSRFRTLLQPASLFRVPFQHQVYISVHFYL